MLIFPCFTKNHSQGSAHIALWVWIVIFYSVFDLGNISRILYAQIRFEPFQKPVLRSDLSNPWEAGHLSLPQRIHTYIARNPKNFSSYKKVASFDSLTRRFIVQESILKYQKTIPLVLSQENYRKELYKNVVRSSFIEIINLDTQNEQTKERRADQGVGFTVPIPMGSRAFSRIFGSAGVGLRVNGNVAMTGSLVQQQQSAVKTAINQASDFTFKLEQKQRFNVTGKIGEKVDVTIDQDSERDFDFENNIRIFYAGEEDEIVKRVEAGNISLSLPGTRFVTFSGSNSGLFGLKTEMQIGNLDLTTIASIEKGTKQKLSIKGGSEEQVHVIKDYEYVTGTYFFADKFYRDSYRVDPQTGLLFASSDPILELEVWKGGRNYQLRSDAREVWAVADPSVYTGTGTYPPQEDQNTRHQYFQRLEQNKDYYLNKELGYIVLNPLELNQPLLPLLTGLFGASTIILSIKTRKIICDWTCYEKDISYALKKINDDEESVGPFSSLSFFNDPAIQKKIIGAYSSKYYPTNNFFNKILPYKKHKKIRIAYFSPDFYNHPVSNLIVELIEKHDKSKFEIYGFSLVDWPDNEVNIRLKKSFTKFLNVEDMLTKDIVRLAREMEIDITIDLAGYSGVKVTTDIFAMRTAPIQINFLGFPGTSGADYFDYIIADPVTIPKNYQKNYSEKIFYLDMWLS